LLDLLPANGDDQSAILCRLYHVSIDIVPPYEALSYSWDTPSDHAPHPTIYIEGRALETMPNLEAFLLQHRKDQDFPCLSLWIDAICINQEDSVERCQQVALMCKLYTRLSRLVVWLGVDDDEESKLTVKLLKLAAKAQREGQVSLRALQESLRSWNRETVVGYTLSVIKFLSRPWFSRSWIVQEFALGGQSNMVFKCGNL
jgi:Heterokaryon incompatibility protein (HET)